MNVLFVLICILVVYLWVKERKHDQEVERFLKERGQAPKDFVLWKKELDQ